MRHTIKNYQLNENVTVEKLLHAKFDKGGWMREIKSPKVRFFKILYEDIELHIELSVSDLKNMEFDEKTNICVFDDTTGQRYISFYQDDVDTLYVNRVIDNYNDTMDKLVDKGIFKEKVKK